MADEVQLRDCQGNPINPKGGGGTPSSVSAANVTVATGTGLNSSNVQGALGELNDKIESSGGGSDGVVFDMAIGNKDESCIVNDAANGYVGNVSLSSRPNQENNQDVVVLAHDDLPESDYVATRKIYNKYNYHATFNYILKPFTSSSDKDKQITNTKRMIADGHEIGLHAILTGSFFWRNLLYDATPDSGSLFAPSLSEMKTVVANGKNVFGIDIDANSTFTTVKHGGDSSIASVKIASATSAQWFTAVSYYAVYTNPDTITGLDLNNNSVTKTYLGWLEYWYNELIDNTLGYSTYTGTIAQRFAADYSGIYPDAAHVLSGELSAYGTFTKGLFKGCHSCCNFEVLDRIVSVAEAFCRRFFGLTYFTNMAYHGVKYANLHWTGQNGALYINRDCTIIATGHSPLYMSLKGRNMTLFDVLKSHGIRINKRNYPDDPARVEGEIGLYKGQKNIRGSFFNDLSAYHFNSYLALLGTSSGSSGMNDNISYQTLMDSMPDDYSQWAKYAYENAGQDISGNGSVYMLSYYKQVIDLIRKSVGTGKLTFIGVDTIQKSPSIMAAVELVCQYCYKHNIRICTATEAMTICNNGRNVDGNVFPNASFRQSLLEDFGGSSSAESAYTPDGFSISGNAQVRVSTVDENKVLTMSGGTAKTTLSTRVYGLPSGKYKFSVMAKSNNSASSISLSKKMNGDKVSDGATTLTTLTAEGSFEELTYEFNIPEPHRNASDGSYVNAVCDGYEDNLAYIQISITAETGKTTEIYNPKIERV